MKRCQLFLLKCVVMLVSCLAGSSKAAEAEHLRYLFLIDHSPEMATRQIATVQIIYDAIRTGFQGEIQAGDKFALWFYGSRLQSNAPFTWQAGHEQEYARAAANLFTGRIYSRLRPREKTLADAAPFIAASPKITVFIITDGSQPLVGTPFDTAINAVIDQNHFALTRADKPFVITLLAKNGNWVDGNIFADAAQPFQIPEMDRRNELMDKALAAVRTAGGSAQKLADSGEIDKARAALRDALTGKAPLPAPEQPAPAAKMEFAPALKEAPKEEPKPVEQAKPTVDKSEPLIFRPKTDVAETPKPNPPPQKIETPAPPPSPQPIAQKPVEVAVAAPSPTLVEKTPEAKPTPQAQPKLVVREESKSIAPEQPKPIVREEPKPILREDPKPAVREEPKPVVETPPPAPKQAPVVTKPVGQPKPAQTPIVETPKPKPAAVPIQTATVMPAQKHFPWPILATGFGLIAIGGGIALLRAKRRTKSPGSIITQALPNSRPRLK